MNWSVNRPVTGCFSRSMGRSIDRSGKHISELVRGSVSRSVSATISRPDGLSFI